MVLTIGEQLSPFFITDDIMKKFNIDKYKFDSTIHKFFKANYKYGIYDKPIVQIENIDKIYNLNISDILFCENYENYDNTKNKKDIHEDFITFLIIVAQTHKDFDTHVNKKFIINGVQNNTFDQEIINFYKIMLDFSVLSNITLKKNISTGNTIFEETLPYLPANTKYWYNFDMVTINGSDITDIKILRKIYNDIYYNKSDKLPRILNYYDGFRFNYAQVLKNSMDRLKKQKKIEYKKDKIFDFDVILSNTYYRDGNGLDGLYTIENGVKKRYDPADNITKEKCAGSGLNNSASVQCVDFVWILKNDKLVDCLNFLRNNKLFKVSRMDIESKLDPIIAKDILKKFGFRLHYVFSKKRNKNLLNIESIETWKRDVLTNTSIIEKQVAVVINANVNIFDYLQCLVRFVNRNKTIINNDLIEYNKTCDKNFDGQSKEVTNNYFKSLNRHYKKKRNDNFDSHKLLIGINSPIFKSISSFNPTVKLPFLNAEPYIMIGGEQGDEYEEVEIMYNDITQKLKNTGFELDDDEHDGILDEIDNIKKSKMILRKIYEYIKNITEMCDFWNSFNDDDKKQVKISINSIIYEDENNNVNNDKNMYHYLYTRKHLLQQCSQDESIKYNKKCTNLLNKLTTFLKISEGELDDNIEIED